jgi:hypothetical protein
MLPDLGLMMSSLAGGGISKGKTIGHFNSLLWRES